MRFKGENLDFEVLGASHASSIGGEARGLPAGETVDLAELQAFLLRRAPGRGEWATKRREADEPLFLSGLRDGVLTCEALRFEIRNTNQRSEDYEKLEFLPRPGHADYTAYMKSAGKEDLRGGGRYSGRMTAPICVLGGIALQILRRGGIEIGAHILSVAQARDAEFPLEAISPEELHSAAKKAFPVLDDRAGERMQGAIRSVAANGDSIGGQVEVAATGLPIGLGGPLFEGLDGKLAQAFFAIPALKGVEFGEGFSLCKQRGSQANDPFAIENGELKIKNNRSGGILGGMSSGAPLVVRLAFKPTPSIAHEQQSVDLKTMEERVLRVGGRHDPCIVPRAVPVCEAMMAIVLLDGLLAAERLQNKENRV
ncbi:MAG: chorismate synthase [Christensenellaceae bacterium]|jgi:chorismate synthase|nr:chorismate synthase [Christensenellaceae bacterium]